MGHMGADLFALRVVAPAGSAPWPARCAPPRPGLGQQPGGTVLGVLLAVPGGLLGLRVEPLQPSARSGLPARVQLRDAPVRLRLHRSASSRPAASHSSACRCSWSRSSCAVRRRTSASSAAASLPQLLGVLGRHGRQLRGLAPRRLPRTPGPRLRLGAPRVRRPLGRLPDLVRIGRGRAPGLLGRLLRLGPQPGRLGLRGRQDQPGLAAQRLVRLRRLLRQMTRSCVEFGRHLVGQDGEPRGALPAGVPVDREPRRPGGPHPPAGSHALVRPRTREAKPMHSSLKPLSAAQAVARPAAFRVFRMVLCSTVPLRALPWGSVPKSHPSRHSAPSTPPGCVIYCQKSESDHRGAAPEQLPAPRSRPTAAPTRRR